MFRIFLVSSAVVASLRLCAGAQTGGAQIEQARLLPRPVAPENETLAGTADFPDLAEAGTMDDAFGAQVIMKEQPRARPFTAFAEAAAFFTNNVGLAKRARARDGFMIASAGAAYSRRLPGALRLDAGVRTSVYRYAEYRELDFQSADASAGLAWSPPKLRGAEMLLRYTFTDLTTAEHRSEFFKNHAVSLGMQNAFALSRALSVYGGVQAQWSWADPREAGRDEYSVFAGCRLQMTRSVDADVSYRYARFVYREADGRQDDNHSISLTARYSPHEWLSLSTTGFAGFNRSNRAQFDYDVLNAGCAVQAAVRF